MLGKIAVTIVVLSFLTSVHAQGTSKQDVPTSTPEQIEANKRTYEALRDPTFVRIKLVYLNPQNDEISALAAPYKHKDPVNLQLVVNHSFSGPLSLEQSMNSFRNLQLELRRDGDVVAFTKAAARSMEITKDRYGSERTWARQVPPEQDYRLRRINLAEWFGTLPPGHYELTAKLRLVPDGNWVKSDSITFDIQL